MEEYLIFAVIGGLLLLTLFVNSVTEAYEQKQREKRIKILKIKQGMDELSDLLERLKVCNISSDVRDLLLNEIMARLQSIQRIDHHFRGIQALIDEASEGVKQEPIPNNKVEYDIKDESEFKKKLVTLRRLIKQLNSSQWYSKVKAEQLQQMARDTKLLRSEKIFQFYSDKANAETEKQNFLGAKEYYHYILHALKNSAVGPNPRITELQEQCEFMLGQIDEMIAKELHKVINEDEDAAEQLQETQEQNDASNEENEPSTSETNPLPETSSTEQTRSET